MKGIEDQAYLDLLQKLVRDKYLSLKDEQYLVRKKQTMDYMIQRGFEADLVEKFTSQLTK